MITLLVVLVIIGVVLWLVRPYVEARIFTAIVVVIILLVALAILNLIGVGPRIPLR